MANKSTPTLKDFIQWFDMRPINYKHLFYFGLFVLGLNWLDDHFNIPLRSDIQIRQNLFLEKLPLIFPNDESLEVEFSGKSGGVIFLIYSGGYSFDNSRTVPDGKYIEKIESLGYVKNVIHPEYYCKGYDESINLTNFPTKNKWMMTWRYPDDQCKRPD